jgi:hypothetical protein
MTILLTFAAPALIVGCAVALLAGGSLIGLARLVRPGAGDRRDER